MPRLPTARWGLPLVLGVGLVLGACADNDGGGASASSATAAAESMVGVSAPESVPSSAVVAPIVSSAPVSLPTTAEITTTTVDPSAPPACSLLTPEEMAFVAGKAAVLGEGKADEPQETPYGAHTACTWTATKGGDITVRVSVWDDSAAYDDARTQVGVAGEVDGVGERAFSSTLSSIYAVAGGHTFFVQFQDLDRDDAANLAATTSLAQLAAQRL
ncbi:MAG: hypothetical protein QM733_11240 [Ilumatobacteraceae bacterium]